MFNGETRTVLRQQQGALPADATIQKYSPTTSSSFVPRELLRVAATEGFNECHRQTFWLLEKSGGLQEELVLHSLVSIIQDSPAIGKRGAGSRV